MDFNVFFCFIPIAPVVTTAAISVIPLGIALCVALPVLLIFEINNTYNTYTSIKKMTNKDIEAQQKHMLEKKIVALNEQKIFLDLKSKEPNSTIELKDSPLIKDLNTVIKHRRFRKYHAICMGFLDGCFLPLFGGWLFLDSTKVILTFVLCPSTVAFTSFTPIGLVATAIITGITLLIGICYGIYSAYKAKQIHEARFENLETKITALRDELPNKKILKRSMRDYDRLLRRFSDEQPTWTKIKKVLSRFLVIVKRLGTGSLVFRLVIWGPISAAVAASTAIMPAFFPIILIVGTAIGALVIASWYFYAYNLESKFTQAGRIVEYLVQIEQLDSINKDLQEKPVEECVSTEKLSTEVEANKLVNSPENDTQVSGSEVVQESSIVEKKDSVDAITATAPITIVRPKDNSNSNLHRLFKNAQDIEKSDDQSMEACLSNIVITC